MSAGRERTEDIRNEEARIKRLLGLDVARLALGADFEGTQYSPLGVNVIEFVNVSTSIAAAQTGSGGPAQVTGLSAVVNSQTQITLSWTAVAGATSYNVYYGFVSGGASNVTTNITSPGAVHSGLTPGTTYYYQVAAVNAVGEGPLSAEVSATTTTYPPPAQVTGLTVTVISSNQLNVAWTAVSSATSYNVYRSTVSGTGFVVVANPTPNSYNNTGLAQGTTYYYKVSAINAVGEGVLSTQASGTTLSAPSTTDSLTPTVEFHFDNEMADWSPYSWETFSYNSNDYVLPGKFGVAGWRCNTPTTPSIQADLFEPEILDDPVELRMDVDVVGMSFSLWVYPVNISALPYRRVIMEKGDTKTQKWSLQIDSAGILYFFVKKAGTDYKRQVSGFTTGSWQHIAATFNAATNTIAVYRNGVAGVASTATPQWPGTSAIDGDTSLPGHEGPAPGLRRRFVIGTRIPQDYSAEEPPATNDPSDGGNFQTNFVGYYDEIRYYKGVVLTTTEINNLMTMNVTGTLSPPLQPDLWLALNNSLTDSSGNGNTASFTPTGGNVAFGTTGKFGSHYAIINYPTTSVLNQITVPTSATCSLDLASAGFSISFWFYMPSGAGNGTSNMCWLVSKYESSGNWAMVEYYPSAMGGDNTILFEVAKRGTVYARKTQTPVTFDTWHHVVCTWGSSFNYAEIYYDKNIGTSATPTGFSVTGATSWYIGRNGGSTNVNGTFRGRIDEFQYFRGRPLNQTQVNNMFNSNAPLTG